MNFFHPAIVLSMFMFSFVFVIADCLFDWMAVSSVFFIINLYLYCRWRTNYQEEQGWDPMNQFKTVTFLCLSRTRTWISNVIYRGLFYFQWFVMRDDWSFYWYWRNCWPSLFKLSLHKLLTDDVDIRSMPILNYIQHTQCTHLRLVIWVSCGFSVVETLFIIPLWL
jgi:hypothetical protein